MSLYQWDCFHKLLTVLSELFEEDAKRPLSLGVDPKDRERSRRYQRAYRAEIKVAREARTKS